MFLRSLSWGLSFALIASSALLAQTHELRICADPDNMPFSNMQRQGFENRLADFVASALDAHLTYVWQRMGRGFIREYLNNSKCDLLIGVPTNYPPVLTTIPYYRSSYVFVSRRDHKFQIASFDAPQLRGLRVGVQVLDEDYTPPAHALARRGMQGEIVGFESTGEQADSIIRAVVDRKIDVAIVWGPLAGFFARRYTGVVEINPVQPEIDPPALPFTFAISMAVRRGNDSLRDELTHVIAEHQREIHEILNDFSVPQLALNSARVEAKAGQ